MAELEKLSEFESKILNHFLSSALIREAKERHKAAKSRSSSSSAISTRHIQLIINRLCMEKHRDSTKATYYRVWKLFNQFFLKIDVKPCSWEDRLVLFTGFLVNNKLKSTTVKSYVVAIQSVLTELGEEIKMENYLIKSLTKAFRIRNDHIIHRLPISKGVLELLLNSLDRYFTAQPYLQLMYMALFTSAYYGLLRIGEVAQSPHVLLAKNVHVGINKKKILFILLSSKTHNEGDKPQLIKISSSPLPVRKKPSYGH